MIKILHVLTDTNTGGAGVLLLNQLKHFDREVFDISVVLPRGSELVRRVTALGYRTVETSHGADRSFELTAIPEYASLVRAEKPDIIHCHGALSARLAALLVGVPIRLHTRHCAYPPPTLLRHFPLRQVCGALNSALSTAIVAVASAAAKNLTDTGTPRRKINIIINGVEPLRLLGEDERRAVRSSLGFTDADFVAGIFARIEECKGHIHLLRALALAGENSRLKILVCGRGSLEAELRRVAEELGVAGRVVFAGFVEDITHHMNAIDVNVNCSVGTETSSLALSEGMSLGKPAVVSDYGGNPDMVVDGVSGFVVPAADPRALVSALARLEGDRELLARMGAAAYRRYTEQFTAVSMTGALEELYTRLYRQKKIRK
ncbi:MAG TPA: glycosyltransferase [Clostridiales bacterium]|jgi:glycosyltransferase involved in cell wall biosynthesis|nr:glycosyltransferase [Clostridiales bacterium]